MLPRASPRSKAERNSGEIAYGGQQEVHALSRWSVWNETRTRGEAIIQRKRVSTVQLSTGQPPNMLCFAKRVIVQKERLVISGIHLSVAFIGSMGAVKNTADALSEPKKQKTSDHTPVVAKSLHLNPEQPDLQHGVSEVPVNLSLQKKRRLFVMQIRFSRVAECFCDRARAFEVRMLCRTSNSGCRFYCRNHGICSQESMGRALEHSQSQMDV